MVDSGVKDRDYLSLLDDEEDSDNEDANWKRRASSSSSTRARCIFNDSGDSGFDRKVTSVKRNQNFDLESCNQKTTRTAIRTVKTISPSASVVPINPSTSKVPSLSGSVWKRLSFPEERNDRDSSPISKSHRNVPTLKPLTPPSSSLSSEAKSSPPSVNRKPISPPSSIDSCDVRTRLTPIKSEAVKEASVPQRPPIPDTLNFKPPQPLFTPPRPKYTDRDADLNIFVKKIKAEMLFHQSLDRIYNRSLRDFPAMRAVAEFPSLIHYVIEGVLFDPEIELDDDTVHKIIKLMSLFELDNTITWTFLIDKVYNLVTKSTDTHYVRMTRFIEMSFNHLYQKKIRLLPETACSLLKLAQVHPFNSDNKPNLRTKSGAIKTV